ncbi:MAG: MBOAT family protein, partial [Parvibaculum sp.]
DEPGIFSKLGDFAWRVVGVFMTFHLVCFSWIFFRSDSFSTAADYLAGFFNWSMDNSYTTPFVVGLIALAMLFQFTPRNLGRELAISIRALPFPALGLLLGFGLLAIWAIAPEGVAPFIYFQF